MSSRNLCSAARIRSSASLTVARPSASSRASESRSSTTSAFSPCKAPRLLCSRQNKHTSFIDIGKSRKSALGICWRCLTTMTIVSTSVGSMQSWIHRTTTGTTEKKEANYQTSINVSSTTEDHETKKKEEANSQSEFNGRRDKTHQCPDKSIVFSILIDLIFRLSRNHGKKWALSGLTIEFTKEPSLSSMLHHSKSTQYNYKLQQKNSHLGLLGLKTNVPIHKVHR